MTSFSEITADGDGLRIRLPQLAIIGARYRELKRRVDHAWVQPGSAQSWLDFCRRLAHVVSNTSTWDQWDASAVTLDQAHPTKFTDLTRRLEGQRPVPPDLDNPGVRMRAVMQYKEKTGTTAGIDEIWAVIQKQQQAATESDGLRDYLQQALEWAKSAGYARGMPLEEFEPGFQPKTNSSLEDLGVYRISYERDDESIASLRWLIDHQAEVVELLRPSLVKTFEEMREQETMEEIWFPEGDQAALALDRFQIESIAVRQDRIILSFEVPGGLFGDHGCYGVIRNGLLHSFGTGDEVFAIDP